MLATPRPVDPVMATLEITNRNGYPLGFEYEVKGTKRCFDWRKLEEIKCWIIDNEIEGGFYQGSGTIGFAREEDRTMFLLRWALVNEISVKVTG